MEIDQQLRDWAAHQRGQASGLPTLRLPPFDADSHGRVRAGRGIVAAVGIVLCLAVAYSLITRTPNRLPSSTGTGCGAQVSFHTMDELQSLPPIVGYGLRYDGSAPCSIQGGAVGLELLVDGKVTLVSQPRPDGSVTLRHDDDISFSIAGFLGCVSIPNGTLSLRALIVSAPRGHTASVALSVPSDAAPTRCPTQIKRLGTVSPIAVRHAQQVSPS
jgi:hypothetical protein